jgi:pimeloyl-ACP methyl ester carboxylesterase
VLGRDLDRLARGRTLICYDMRGRGRSGRVRVTSLQTDLEDLEEVRAWFGLESFSLLGFDYGSALISHYAAQHPEHVRSLVLVSPLPIRKQPFWDIYEQLTEERMDQEAREELQAMRREHVRRLDPERWAQAYKETALSGWVEDSRALRRMKSEVLVEPNDDPEQVHRDYLALLRSLEEWDWRESLARIACPTLVVTGSADPMPAESTQEWLGTLPDAHALVIERSGRLPWVERPGDFLGAVDEFLDDSTPAH